MIVNSAAISAEIDYARSKLKDRRDEMRRIVDGMAGRTRISTGHSANKLIHNHYHQYTSLIVPRMCSGDPRIRVTTPRANEARISALAGEAYVNGWILQTQHRIFCQKMATDCSLGWGMALLHLDRISGFDDDDDDPVATPILTRLDQGDAWFDTLATAWELKKFSGYDYSQDHREAIARSEKEPGWYKSAVRNLPVDIDEQEHQPTDAPRRGEVRIREFWMPSFRLPNAPKNTNGTIFTLGITGAGGSSAFLRAPRPYFGPTWGPIYLYDIYYVPGQPLGMAPCEAVAAQVDEVNMHAEALSASTRARKKIGVANLMDKGDAELIRTTPEGGMALLTGSSQQSINDIVKELQLGGATAEQRQGLAEALATLERNSSLDDAGRGRADPNVTATATAQAGETQGIRTGYVAQRFSDCDAQALRGVLWYVIHSRALRMHIDPEQLGITPQFLKNKGLPPEAIHQIEVEIRGGPNRGLSFEDYTLSLDRYSMERVSEGLMQQRALQLGELTLKFAQAAPVIAPFTDVRLVMDNIGNAFNQPEYGQVISPEKAAEFAGKMAMQQQQQPDAEYTRPGAGQLPGPKAGQRAIAGVSG